MSNRNSHHSKKDFMKKIILVILTTLALSLTALPVFAVSDSTLTLTPETSGSQYLCGGSSSVSCSGYQYLLVNINSTSARYVDSYITSNYTLTSAPDTFISSRISASPLTTSYVISLPSDLNSLYVTKPSWFSQGTVTLTLSESQGCPACPTPEPCPDPDEPFIVGLFREGFWGVATAVVALIVPIVALFLVFRLIHDFFWGRG